MKWPSRERWNDPEAWAWWLGVPFMTACVTWGPYLIRNLVLGQKTWFRIPFVGDSVFDTAAYLQPVGHAALGIPEAALIGPFARVISTLAMLFPHASVAELWLVTRWVSAVAAIWIGAWAVRTWTGRGTRFSRLISLTLWIALGLVLGMKPGVFSWFFPCGLVGFAVVPLVSARLREEKIIPAIAWTVLGFIVTSVYAWYQLFIMPWLGVVWFLWFASRSLRLSSIWYAIGAVCGAITMALAGFWVATTEQGTILLELYTRLSFSPTRMIFISGSVLLTALWIPLFIPLLRRLEHHSEDGRRIMLTAIGWITLLLIFFHSPFTGSYIQNDHFRSAAAIAAWLSLALVWSVSRRPLAATNPLTSSERAMVLVPFFVAAIFVIKILLAPYAWNGDQVNIVQLTHWFGLCGAAWLSWRWVNGKSALGVLPFAYLLAGASLIIGGNAYAAAMTREFTGMQQVGRLQPLWTWVEENVAPTDSLCTDHQGDGFSLDDQLSAITGRVVHFAHTTLYHKERNEAFLGRMQTVAGFFDVHGSGDEGYWKPQATLNQFIVCDQFPLQTKLLKTFGLTQNAIDRLISCPRNQIDAWWAPIQNAIDHPKPDAAAFKKICPYVVIPEKMKPYWHLPSGYTEHQIMSDMSVWSLK